MLFAYTTIWRNIGISRRGQITIFDICYPNGRRITNLYENRIKIKKRVKFRRSKELLRSLATQ